VERQPRMPLHQAAGGRCMTSPDHRRQEGPETTTPSGCQIDRLPPGVHTTRRPPVPAISHASYSACGLTERVLASAKCTSRHPSLYALAEAIALPRVESAGPNAVGCAGDNGCSPPEPLKTKSPSMRIVVVLSCSHNSIPKAWSTRQRVTVFPCRGTTQ